MLKIGELLPEFELLDQNEQLQNSQNWLGSPVVVYFYPKDNTPVCTTEACTFRDEFESFRELNVQVIGISADSPKSHKKFATKHNLPFTLLSDMDLSVEKLFGLKRQVFGLLAPRVTFIFDAEGKLVENFDSRLNGKAHVKAALASIQKS